MLSSSVTPTHPVLLHVLSRAAVQPSSYVDSKCRLQAQAWDSTQRPPKCSASKLGMLVEVDLDEALMGTEQMAPAGRHWPLLQA